MPASGFAKRGGQLEIWALSERGENPSFQNAFPGRADGRWRGGSVPRLFVGHAISGDQEDLDLVVCAGGWRIQRDAVGILPSSDRGSESSVLDPAIFMGGIECDHHLPGEQSVGVWESRSTICRRRRAPLFGAAHCSRCRRSACGRGGRGHWTRPVSILISAKDFSAALAACRTCPQRT